MNTNNVKYFILIIAVFIFLFSCKQDESAKKMSIEFIEQENLKLYLEVCSIYEENGRRESDRFYYDLVSKIRNSREKINHQFKKSVFDDSFIFNIDQYRSELDSISNVIGYTNSSFVEMLNRNLKNDPIDYLITISLYESEVLRFIRSDFSNYGDIFTSCFQFDKRSYQKGDSSLFTYVTLGNELFPNFKYDSVTFYLNNERQEIDYSLDQILSTAIVKFILPDSGSYYLTVYSSFDSPIQKEIVGQRSTRFMVE